MKRLPKLERKKHYFEGSKYFVLRKHGPAKICVLQQNKVSLFSFPLVWSVEQPKKENDYNYVINPFRKYQDGKLKTSNNINYLLLSNEDKRSIRDMIDYIKSKIVRGRIERSDIFKYKLMKEKYKLKPLFGKERKVIIFENRGDLLTKSVKYIYYV